MKKAVNILIIIGIFVTISSADVWKTGKQIDKVGTFNLNNVTYCFFTLTGVTGHFCFDVAGDYGKSRYAFVLAARTNGLAIDAYVYSAAIVSYPNWLSCNKVEMIFETGM